MQLSTCHDTRPRDQVYAITPGDSYNPPTLRGRAASPVRCLLSLDVRRDISPGDAGEGLVDAESRLAERPGEQEQERQRHRTVVLSGDPETVRDLESCRLVRTALAEMDRRIAELLA